MSLNIDHYLTLDPKSPEGQAFCAGFLHANKDRLDRLDDWLNKLEPDQRQAVLVLAAEHAFLGQPIPNLTQLAQSLLNDPLNRR